MTSPRRRPGRPRRTEQRQTPELILAAATTLFARHGFEAVGMRDVALAAGVDVATVHHHAGSKADLYDACFRRVFEVEQAVLAEAAGMALAAMEVVARDGSLAQSAALASLHDLLDAFVDFLEDHPQATGLWLRRWLEPDRHTDLDAKYATPLYRLVERVLARGDELGVLVEPLPHVAVRSLVWAVHAHAVRVLSGQSSARERREFRAFTHRWLRRLYG